MTETVATLTLTDFLLARIAEDEAAANRGDLENIPSDCWGPERVLAECEAKRQFVAWFDREDTQYSPRDGIHAGLRILAAVCADHPDYREEWKP